MSLEHFYDLGNGIEHAQAVAIFERKDGEQVALGRWLTIAMSSSIMCGQQEGDELVKYQY